MHYMTQRRKILEIRLNIHVKSVIILKHFPISKYRGVLSFFFFFFFFVKSYKGDIEFCQKNIFSEIVKKGYGLLLDYFQDEKRKI